LYTYTQSNLSDVVQQINAKHEMVWRELIHNSDPPVPRTPVSAFIELFKFYPRAIAMKNDKIKRVLGFEFKHPEFNQAEIEDIVDAWIEDNAWPI
jgi:hypothetical protein